MHRGGIMDNPDATEMERQVPIEFLIGGVPVSLQASGGSRDTWKARVLSAATTADVGGEWAIARPIYMTILHFPDSEMIGDIDNIVKPILDALAPNVYSDDNQVERVWVQKFEPGRVFSVETPTPTLAAALDSARPVTYIRIDDDETQKALPL
jgi:crossover junction endodeoxyribonuclease RusA